MLDSLLKLIEGNIDKIPYMAMVAGKPKINTAKMIEQGIGALATLAVLLPQVLNLNDVQSTMSSDISTIKSELSRINTRVDKVDEKQIELINDIQANKIKLENLTTIVDKMDSKFDKIQGDLYSPIGSLNNE